MSAINFQEYLRYRKDWPGEHFKLEKLLWSDDAVKFGIDNMPSHEQYRILESFVLTVLDPLRKAWGGPLIVDSGFRCPALNAIVTGDKNSTSDHRCLTGAAADLRSDDPISLAKFIVHKTKLPFDQLIIHPQKYLHVGWKLELKKNRHEIFSADSKGKLTEMEL